MYWCCSQDFKKILHEKVSFKSFVENSKRIANRKERDQGYSVHIILLLMNNVLRKMFLNSNPLFSLKENSKVLGFILRDYNIIYSVDLREFVQLLSGKLICQHRVSTSLLPLYFLDLLGFCHLLLYHLFLLAPLNCWLLEKWEKYVEDVIL